MKTKPITRPMTKSLRKVAREAYALARAALPPYTCPTSRRDFTQAQLFADNSQPASASILLSDSGNLDSSAVRGIANLVASSVPGLQLGKVTITDGTGQLLWPTSASGSAGGSTSKQAADNQYDASTAAAATALLAQTLGPGKAQVVVNADVDANQATSDSLVYAKKGVPLTQQTQTETLIFNPAGYHNNVVRPVTVTVT